jgi:pectate lyase
MARNTAEPRARLAPAIVALTAVATAFSVTAVGPANASPRDDRARETLSTGDGWGSEGSGTSGGSAAANSQVFTATTRTELLTALEAADEEPSIIRIRGTIDMDTSTDGGPLTCADYADPEWDRAAYLEAYDPAHYEGDPEGPLEDARARSHDAQLANVQIDVPSNVTIIGTDRARLLGASLMVRGENVILRNFEVSGLENCFPQRNTDGWVSEGFDLVSLIGATNVWIDHVTLEGPYGPDEPLEKAFGDTVHRIDGLLDITNAADLVTVSWSTIKNGSTSILIGNGDNRPEDEGRLKVTLHHNRFQNLSERAPRVRYGTVHVYNNLFVVPDAERYVYSWGAGVRSNLWIEDNTVLAARGVEPADLLRNWGGTHVHVGRTLFNGRSVDALAAHNATAESPLTPYDGPAPVLYGERHPLRSVTPIVLLGAGAHRL